MGELTPAALLAAWEQGHGHGPTLRALALLAAASPEASREELSELPLGERDRRLLELRRELASGPLAAVARCPACGAELEAALDQGRLAAAAGGEDTAGEPGEQGAAGDEGSECDPGGPVLRRGGLELRFRPPNSLDLLAA